MIFSRKTILILLYILHVGIFYGQTSEVDLHKKYWYYKSRFNNDFISIGTNTGQSIPFNQRGFNEDYTYTAPTATLKTGDGTVQLGIYISVLATEYRLLKDKGQFDALPRVKHELFCALNAVNRLDYFAEPIISANPVSVDLQSVTTA